MLHLLFIDSTNFKPFSVLGNITIGDFWGLSKDSKIYDDEKRPIKGRNLILKILFNYLRIFTELICSCIFYGLL